MSAHEHGAGLLAGWVPPPRTRYNRDGGGPSRRSGLETGTAPSEPHLEEARAAQEGRKQKRQTSVGAAMVADTGGQESRAVSLTRYCAERGRSLDDARKLWRSLKQSGRIPEPAGFEAGHGPLYRETDLDHARGIIDGYVTLAEFAAEHDLAAQTLRETWLKRYRDLMPEPLDVTRLPGGAKLYPRTGLMRVLRVVRGLPPDPVGSPADRLTWRQVRDYVQLKDSTMASQKTRGLWPESGHDPATGEPYWLRGHVDRLCLEPGAGKLRPKSRTGNPRT